MLVAVIRDQRYCQTAGPTKHPRTSLDVTAPPFNLLRFFCLLHLTVYMATPCGVAVASALAPSEVLPPTHTLGCVARRLSPPPP